MLDISRKGVGFSGYNWVLSKFKILMWNIENMLIVCVLKQKSLICITNMQCKTIVLSLKYSISLQSLTQVWNTKS